MSDASVGGQSLARKLRWGIIGTGKIADGEFDPTAHPHHDHTHDHKHDHSHDDHDHDHHHMENVHDCQECIALENLNDCVLNDNELNFSKNEKNQFRYSYSNFFDFDIL
mgnify:CR=1 FL=1